jgi:hypothetical protein
MAVWIDGAVKAAALVSLIVALVWQDLAMAALACASLCLAVYAAARPLANPHGNVSAMLVTRDGAVYVRMRQGWQPLELIRSWPGLRWLTLRGRISAAPSDPAQGAGTAPRTDVTFTVWQDALARPAWRRVCLLTGRRLRRMPARRMPEPS